MTLDHLAIAISIVVLLLVTGLGIWRLRARVIKVETMFERGVDRRSGPPDRRSAAP